MLGAPVPETRKHYLYLNDDGLPEAVDVETGEVIAMEIHSKDLHKYRSMVVDGRRRWVPLVDLATSVRFSPLFADQFINHILDGHGVRRVCEMMSIEYREYVNMRKAYPEFGEMVDEARKDRAELFFEKIEEVAEQTEADEEEVALGRLKLDAYKHLSGVADPAKFGTKTQVTGKLAVGVIQIETGIRRVGDPGFTEARLAEEIEKNQKQIEEEDKQVATVIQNPHKNPMKAE
jgi:hypothetical protein